MLKVLLIIALGLAGTYVVMLLLMFFNQKRFQYFPSHLDSIGKGRGVFQPWKDSKGVFLGYFRPSDAPEKALLVFHGNGGEALDRAWLDEVIPKNILIILVEYPGYGAKSGELSERSFFKAAETVYDEVKAKWDIPVLLLGESLGSGVACYLASVRQVTLLALISPFSSAVDVAASHYSYFPVRLLMKDRFLSEKYLQSVNVPLHIIHGTLDEIVPIQLGRKLFESYKGKKTFTEIPGFGHNDMVTAILNSPLAESFLSSIRQ